MSSSDPTAAREQDVTMNVVITLQASTVQVPAAPKSLGPGLRHYPLLLLLCTVGALVPYMLPSEVTTSIPRVAIVSWYAVIALAAGFCGITWILRTALLTLQTPRETDIRLQGETQKRVLEALSLRSSR
jgi:hypothetical protein